MKIHFNLRRFIERNALSLPKVADDIGITEHQLKHLLDPEAPTINQSHLNKVCNYLVRKQLADKSELPGSLFVNEDDEFWPLLSKRKRIELVTGFRRGKQDWREVVSAADSILQFNVLHQLTEDARQGRQKAARVIDAQLVEAWDFTGTNHHCVEAESKRCHRAFLREKGDRGLVLVGSVKSNPTIEMTLAHCFKKAKPFQSEDDVVEPSERSCPLMIRYRPKDPHPPSCCGGERLSRNQPGKEPGIYYESELEQPWKHVPSNRHCDGALVFYRIDRTRHDCLQMVLGGFSGRATRCLAEYLRNENADCFLPPTFSEPNLDVGIFIVKFSFRPPRGSKPTPDHERISDVEVISLPKEVLIDRVRPAKTTRSRTASASTASKAR